MHRFFVKSEYINNNVVEITGDDFNHISNSLRLQKGDKIIISPGDGYDYIVRLTKFNDTSVMGKITEKEVNQSEPKVKVDLAQSIPKNRNIEFVIQKGTEIGVNSIIPLDTKRTIVKLSKNKEKKRIKRWQKIATEAAKQSQRGKIPEIKGVIDINKKEKVKNLFDFYDLILILYAQGTSDSIKDVLIKYKEEKLNKVLVLVGPEGGFTENEINFLKNINNNIIKTISLGQRILRTETAGLVALSVIFYEFGDLGG